MSNYDESVARAEADEGGRLARSRGYRALADTRDWAGHVDHGRRTAYYEGWAARALWQAEREPTEVEVEAAARAAWPHYFTDEACYAHARDEARIRARAALIAAKEARRG